MIDKLSTNSRVTEVNDVATRSTGAFGASGITDPNLTNNFSNLEETNIELTKAIRRSKAESDLEVKDENRDNQLRSLYYLINGFSHHPVADIKNAALLLLNVFDNYGLKITGDSYATESSLVASMMLEYQKPEYAEAITALSGCGDLMEALAIAESQFEQARIAYETEKAKEGMLQNASELKKQVLDLLNNKIVIYLRAMELVNPEVYGVFTATIAQIIADNNEQVKRRQKQEPEPVPPV
jgi:hypothetical protein